MSDLDAILSRLDDLEQENARLRARLARLEGPAAHDDPASEPAATPPGVSRRAILGSAGRTVAALGIGSAAAAVATLAHADAALAAGDNGKTVTVAGAYADVRGETVLQNVSTNSDVLRVTNINGSGTGLIASSKSGSGVIAGSVSGEGLTASSGSGYAIFADSDTGTGIRAQGTTGVFGVGPTAGISGSSSGGIGVEGRSTSKWGVSGTSTGDVGVRGQCDPGIGVYGQSTSSDGVMGVSLEDGRGIRGESATGAAIFGFNGPYAGARPTPANVGVWGQSTDGRGGVFIGSRAQVQLRAASATSHPTSGGKGDLFVDASGRLWFCKGDTTWVKLA